MQLWIVSLYQTRTNMISNSDDHISAYLSQSTETLYRFLIQNLFSTSKSPFLKKIVIVPSPLMKSWLVKKMADDLGISMGIELFLQEQGMRKIADYLEITFPTIVPDRDQLAFAFQHLIPKLLDDYPFLKIYLEEGHQKRLLLLAHEMAELFLEYGTFDGPMLEEWKNSPKLHWQAALWNLLREEFPQWGMPYQLYQLPEKNPAVDFEVHLFAISFLPAITIRFLESLPFPIYFYHLSPTQTFWEDTLSGTQSRFLRKVWEKKGASAKQLEDLNSYLRTTHPLLANWGKLGRMMVKQLPEHMEQYEELYPLPEQAFQQSEWSELTYPETIPINGPFTLLNKLQADLVTMRPPPENKMDCEQDLSIQVHQMPCKRREIEEIYNIIVGLIDKHKSDELPITPEDVVVMAPEIMDYAPFIQAHFEREESVLDYRLMDIALPAHDSCIRAFRKILSLIKSRWESAALNDLLQMEPFQKKLNIDREDLAKLQKWMTENEVIWGMDRQHHAETLTQNHCSKGVEIHQGTWESFFERTLRALFTAHDDDVVLQESDILPYNRLDINDAELLGKWIATLRDLYRELRSIENIQGSLLEWSVIVDNLAKQFLDTLSPQMEMIFHQFRRAAAQFQNQTFSFDSVLDWFESVFEKGKTSYREQHVNSVRFCSLLPMRAIPGKVIVLCGMSEDAFPRTQQETSQNLMKEPIDPKPKKVDFDRFLMLETILSTRQHLVFTYPSAEQVDGPSISIQELTDLLDRYYTIEGKSVSSKIHFKHPFSKYDPSYFEEQSHRSYSLSAYREALALISEEKQPLCSFIPRFEITSTQIQEQEISLSLKDLESLAKDPLEFYYKKTLGITLKETSHHKTERNLSLSHLTKAMIPRNALKGELEEEILLSKKKGELPEGIFEEIATRTIRQKNNDMHNNLSVYKVDPQELFDYTFERLIFQVDSLPKIILSGTIENISPEGLLIHRPGKPEDFYRFLPRILLFHYFVKEGKIKAKSRILYSEGKKPTELIHPNPKEQIETYLLYWNEARQNPSPLCPSWITHLLNEDGSGLEKQLQDPFGHIYSEYEKANTKFDIPSLMKSSWMEWSRRLHDTPV